MVFWMQVARNLSKQHSSVELRVADYAPEWDSVTGGSKMLISGNFESFQEPLFLLVDGIKVSPCRITAHLQACACRCGQMLLVMS